MLSTRSTDARHTLLSAPLLGQWQALLRAAATADQGTANARDAADLRPMGAFTVCLDEGLLQESHAVPSSGTPKQRRRHGPRRVAAPMHEISWLGRRTVPTATYVWREGRCACPGPEIPALEPPSVGGRGRARGVCLRLDALAFSGGVDLSTPSAAGLTPSPTPPVGHGARGFDNNARAAGIQSIVRKAPCRPRSVASSSRHLGPSP